MDPAIDDLNEDHDASLKSHQQPVVNISQQLPQSKTYVPADGGSSDYGIRSSVAVGAAETTTRVADCDICPSPVVRVSYDRAGVRAVPWTRLPQFRQSRRWAKAHNMECPPRPRTAPEPILIEQCPTTGNDPTRAYVSSVKSDRNSTCITNDRDPLHEGLCGSGSRRGCRRFSQTCLFDHIVPTSSGLKIASSRRRSPVKVIASETRSSSRRVPVPSQVKSNSTSQQSEVVSTLQSAMSTKAPDGALEEENAAAHRSVASETQQSKMSAHEPPDPVDFWNDPVRSKRWSDDCKAILNGDRLLDFNSDWEPRPLTLEPTVSDSNSVNHIPLDGVHHPSNRPLAKPDRKATVPLGSRGPQPPIRTSSKGLVTTNLDPTRNIVRQSTTPDSDAKSYVGTENAGIQSVECSTMPPRSNKGILPSTRTLAISKFNSNLKAAKSIDSMAQIEAQLNSPMEPSSNALSLRRDSSRQRLRKRTPFNSVVMTHSSPAGKPPERPLPALPIIELDENNQDTHHRSRHDGHRRDSPASHHSHEVAPHSRITPVRTVCDVTVELDSPKSRAKAQAIAKGLVIDASSKTRMSSLATPPSSSPGSIYSQDSSMSLTLPGGHSTERGEKTRRLKRKHVAAIMKSKEALREDSYADTKHASTRTALVNPIGDNRHLQGDELLQPPPPPSGVGHVQYHQSSQTSAPVLESDDELPTFPAPPASRPCSRASAAATMHSVQSLTCMSRTTSCSRGPRSKIRGGRLPTAQREARVRRDPVLSKSRIMIVCDTDPSTESFRASTRSPITSLGESPSRHPTPRLEVTQDHSSQQVNPCSYTELGKIDELASSDKVNSLGAKVSLRSLRSQTSNAKLSIGKHGLGRISPVSMSSRNGSKQSRCLIIDTDSDMETDGVSLSPKRGPSGVSLSKTNTRIKSSTRRKDRNVTNLNTETQTYVEEMVRVISKYAGRGNKMAKQMLDQPVWLVSGDPSNGSLSLALATQNLSVSPQKSGDGLSQQRMQVNGRPTSGISSIPTTGTDTDTSANTKKSDHAGSLTDPTDHDTLHNTGRPQCGKEQTIRPRASSPTLDKGSEPRTTTRSKALGKGHKLHTPPPVVASPRRLKHQFVTDPNQEDLENVPGLTDKSDSGIDIDGNGRGGGDKETRLVTVRSFSSSTGSHSGLVVGTERLHGVVEGMKHWPHMNSKYGRNDVKIEKVDGTWRLHSRFDFVGED